ncbi:hypothetical protein HNY73_006763 [Argiope bruennichi]|uniref:Uncharacterized protein n=1 Tax=Argiope bruennichi TaxID=94029 RepID=A0A8T0FBW5_ARGBR|nr:hypothetical protein HNY73_006763 [Argiope bruennichi]
MAGGLQLKWNKTRLFRRTEHGGSSDYRWFDEIKEILHIEKDARKDRRYVAAPRQMDPSLELLYRPYIEANVTELDEEVTAPDFNDDSNSIPDYKYYTAAKHVEPEGTNTNHLSIPDLSTSDSQNITENVLMSCLEEFQKCNRELEANDIAILRQFKEQNDIFRAHTALLRKLLND